jgi:hypothetical protein
MSAGWKFLTSVIDGAPYPIQGLNIWEYNWINTRQYITVKDPIYGQTHTMTVYQIITGTQTITFAAGEFSNLVWGIYLPC